MKQIQALNKIFSISLRYDYTMKKISLLLICCVTSYTFAQIGGTYAFPFLNLTYNARAAGLGNQFITAKDNDINIGISNPSLLNKEMHKMISINQALLAGGINYGQLAYGKAIKKGVLGLSMRYINYGEFKRTTITGEQIGTFNPFECVVGASYGKQLNPRISVGGTMNFIYSQLEAYSSFGLSLDLAGTYVSKDGNLLVTAMVKNAGVQLNGYDGQARKPLPIDFQLGASYKLEHAPFRFSILTHHLNKWDLTYNDPNAKPTIDPLTGETVPVATASFIEKLANHFIFQAEILMSKNLHVRAGFDYHRRQELKLEQLPGLAGFTFGIGFKFKKIKIDYGLSVFSRAGYNNMLTLSSCISDWKK
jgi:hypothetical protein